MRGAVQPAAVEIVAEPLCDRAAELLLPSFVEVALEDSVVHPVRLAGDRAHHRDQRGLELVEDGAELRGPHARLELVQQRVVRVLAVSQRLGAAARESHDPAQPGREAAVVARGAGRVPLLERQRGGLRRLHHQVGRQPGLQVVVVARGSQQRGAVAVVVEPRPFGLGLREQAPGCRADEELVGDLGQRAHLRRAGAGAARRHAGLLVPAEQPHRRPQVVHVSESIFQRVQLLHGVRPPSRK